MSSKQQQVRDKILPFFVENSRKGIAKVNFGALLGNQFYSTIVRGGVSIEFKTIKMEKFPKKYLVWLAIRNCGSRSASFITFGTVNRKLYIRECLQKRLLPFIRSHTSSALFWPNLASCHHSNKTMDWYQSHGIHVVPCCTKIKQSAKLP